MAHQCTTTCVSAGDAGANNFAAFRRYIAAQTRIRLYAFVHIANIGLAGFPVAELYNIDFAQTDVAARAIAENNDMVLGAKLRMSENVIAKHGLEPLKRAINACEQASTGAKAMCHIGGVETRALMSQILDLPRPGDILTHCYSGFPNLSGDFTNIVQEAGCCQRRSPLNNVAWSSISATVAAASTTRWRKRQFSRAACQTPFLPTSTYSPATRRECPTSPG